MYAFFGDVDERKKREESFGTARVKAMVKKNAMILARKRTTYNIMRTNTMSARI